MYKPVRAIGIAVTLFILLRFFLFDVFSVREVSMAPAVQEGSLVLSFSLAYGLRWPFSNTYAFMYAEPAYGQIVVSTVPGENRRILKRVIAKSGDTIRQRHNKLLVNDIVVPFLHLSDSELILLEARTIPENYVFLLGDNRSESRDSRHFGAVPISSISSRAIAVLLPLNRFGGIK